MEYAILLLLVLLFLLLLYIALKLSRGGEKREDPLLLMQQQLEGLKGQFSQGLSSQTTEMNKRLSEVTLQVNQQLQSVQTQLLNTQGQIGSRLDNTAKVVGEVRQNLGELGKSAEKIFDLGKEISQLQEILRAPKLRGVLGEAFLADLLSQILPPNHYRLQHRFKTGDIVDAVVILNQGKISIDSKFPLENFRKMISGENEGERKENRKRFVQDVKKHIDNIAGKYILPDEGTFDFAMMYIPAENVYYETIIKDESFGDVKSLSAYGLSKRVIPVSPNSFYAYLQAIVLGLKGMRIEKSAREIHDNIRRLQGDFGKIGEGLGILGKHLSNTQSRYEELSKKVERFGDRLHSAGEIAAGENEDRGGESTEGGR